MMCDGTQTHREFAERCVLSSTLRISAARVAVDVSVRITQSGCQIPLSVVLRAEGNYLRADLVPIEIT